MRAFLSLAAAAVAATCIAFTARAQQQVQYFYCYVPNAATSTVYMTQTLPVGPVAERGRYGEEYAAYLRGEGLVSASARGYCTMRPTTGEIAVARQDLQSYCAECNGATRFTTAAWARPGLPNAPEPKTAETSIQAVVPQPSTQTVPLAPEKPPVQRLVVIGNDVTGEVLVVTGPNAEKTADDTIARSFPPTGWNKLAASEATGYGAALCVDGPPVSFFVAEGKEQLSDAFIEAAAQARDYGKQVGKRPYVCRHWRVKGGSEIEPAVDSSALDLVKGILVRFVTCQKGEAICRKDARSSLATVGVRG